jgi:hypothetical protein
MGHYGHRIFIRVRTNGCRLGCFRSGNAKSEMSDYWLLLAESYLTRHLFRSMLQRIWALPVPTG